MYYNKDFTKYQNDFVITDEIFDTLMTEGYERQQKELELAKILIKKPVDNKYHNEYLKMFYAESQEDLARNFIVGKLYGFQGPSTDTILYSLQDLSENEQLIVVKSLYNPLSFLYNDIDKTNEHVKSWQNTHEIIISLLANNTLVKLGLHFPLCYGYKLSGPTFLKIDNSKYNVAITAHDKGNKLDKEESYLYSELFDAKTLIDYLKSFDLVTFINVWYQICYALYTAQLKYKFTHYDLHSSNIMIENLIDKITLRYEFENNKYYITTSQLVRIIDLASAYIKVDNVEYGLVDPNTIYVGRNATFHPFQDIYFLLNSIYQLHLTKVVNINKDILIALEYFITFFNDKESLKDINIKQSDAYFAYYVPGNEIKKNMGDFINFCQKKYPLHNNVYNNYNDKQIEYYRYKNLYRLITLHHEKHEKQILKYYLQKVKEYKLNNTLNEHDKNLLDFCQFYYQIIHNPQVKINNIKLLNNIKQKYIKHNKLLLNNLPELQKIRARDYLKNLYSYSFTTL
jgi:hypothetical protein